MRTHIWAWLLPPTGLLLAAGLALTGCHSNTDSMHEEQIQALRARLSTHGAAVQRAGDAETARQETMDYVQDCLRTMDTIEHDTCSMMDRQQMHDMMQPMDRALERHEGQMMDMSDMADMREETSGHSRDMMRALEHVEDESSSSGHGCGHM